MANKACSVFMSSHNMPEIEWHKCFIKVSLHMRFFGAIFVALFNAFAVALELAIIIASVN